MKLAQERLDVILGNLTRYASLFREEKIVECC
mgnify:FL=1